MLAFTNLLAAEVFCVENRGTVPFVLFDVFTNSIVYNFIMTNKVIQIFVSSKWNDWMRLESICVIII